MVERDFSRFFVFIFLSMNNTTLQSNPPPLPSQADPKAAKEKATEEKYQLMSTIQAIRQGKMPHNAQLEEMLNKMIENQVIQSRENKISEDGKILLNDFRELLQTVKKALNVKNKDELFQSMVYHLHCMESPISKGKNKKRKLQLKSICLTILSKK